jgi:hypothetical protein
MQKRIFILQLRASLVLYYFPEGGYHASNMNKMQLELLVKKQMSVVGKMAVFNSPDYYVSSRSFKAF